MALLKINGVNVPDPIQLTVNYMDLSSDNSGRTLNGTMIKDIVSRKTSLNCVWNALTWNEASVLLNAVEQSVFLTVVYPDPKFPNSPRTKVFYVGDRSSPSVSIVGGKAIWSGISFDLIEK